MAPERDAGGGAELVSGGSAGIWLGCAGASGKSDGVTPLNFLWVCLEDTSPRLGCYGDEVARTPAMDQLAAEGRVYRQAFSTAPVCAPARSAVYTGVYAPFAGAQHMRVSHVNARVPERVPYTCVPPPYVKFFTEVFRAHGWFCSNYGKSDTQFELDCDVAPVTAWDLQGWGSEEAPVHWRRRAQGQPFFAVFNLAGTHESRMWPVEGEEVRTDPSRVELPPYLPDTVESRRACARAYDRVAESDAVVGRLMRELEEDGLVESTVVMVWGDHGEGLPRSKRWLYDTGLRVPLIVRWPGVVPAGSVEDGLVSTVDLAPTVLAMAGLPVPAHYQGVPFWGPEARVRTHVFASRDRHDEAPDMVRAVRSERWKYIRNYYPDLPGTVWTPYAYRHPVQRGLDAAWAEGGTGGEQLARERRAPEELYDCERDPWEMENLAGQAEHLEVLRELRGVMDAWQVAYDRFRDVGEEAMVAAMWPGGRRPVTAPPRLVAHGPHHDGQVPLEDGAVLMGPVWLEWFCPTPGASIAYQMDARPEEAWHWQLGGPRLRPGPGVHRVKMKAVRTGYAESVEVMLEFTVREGG